MCKGFVDTAGRSGVDEHLGNFAEGVGIGAERDQFTGTSGALVPKAEVKHSIAATVLHHVGIGSEAAVAGVGRGRLGRVHGIGCGVSSDIPS